MCRSAEVRVFIPFHLLTLLCYESQLVDQIDEG